MRCLLLAVLLMACESAPVIAPPKDLPVVPEAKPGVKDAAVPPQEVDEVAYAVSSGRSVLWKRYAALERDLMRALELGQDELCRELGDRNCIRDVHLIALGGNDPFGSGIHRPPPGTLGTTPIVIDRVLLSACSARAAADRAGHARVFTHLDLAGGAPGVEAANATTTTLFRRLLARDPTAEELTQVASLLEPGEGAPQTGEEFAVLACFTVGSSLEFLFE